VLHSLLTFNGRRKARIGFSGHTASQRKPGLRKAAVAAQRLDINQALKVDIKLEVGASTETVSVEAIATNVATVTSTYSNSATQSQIQNAPLKSCNVMDLALLMRGVVPSNLTPPSVPACHEAPGRY
jgi:hypothetical protein